MSSFTEELEVRVLNRTEYRRRMVENLRRFAYEVGRLGSGDLVEVQKGATSDFGSLPQLAWLIDPPFGSCAKADFVHDALYRDGSRPRAEADRIWLEAMGVEARALREARQDYAPAWWRILRYLVVRLLGWRSYGPRHPSRRPRRRRILWDVATFWIAGLAFSLSVWLSLAWLARALLQQLLQLLAGL